MLKKSFLILFKWLITPLVLFGLFSVILYSVVQPKQQSNWVPEHSLLPNITINEQLISVNNIRNFEWGENTKQQHINMQFQLENIVKMKTVVSHFSPISGIAHVFIIFVLDDGRELGVSVEARREQGESFSIQGGLLARFELMYVLATPQDLLGIRQLNNESIHQYPIKTTPEQTQALFKLIANDVNDLNNKPRMYHLFFKNCTNQLVKHVSTLTQEEYPWFFQTFAPGKTGEILFDLGLIDLDETSFDQIQKSTLLPRIKSNMP